MTSNKTCHQIFQHFHHHPTNLHPQLVVHLVGKDHLKKIVQKKMNPREIKLKKLRLLKQWIPGKMGYLKLNFEASYTELFYLVRSFLPLYNSMFC